VRKRRSEEDDSCIRRIMTAEMYGLRMQGWWRTDGLQLDTLKIQLSHRNSATPLFRTVLIHTRKPPTVWQKITTYQKYTHCHYTFRIKFPPYDWPWMTLNRNQGHNEYIWTFDRWIVSFVLNMLCHAICLNRQYCAYTNRKNRRDCAPETVTLWKCMLSCIQWCDLPWR